MRGLPFHELDGFLVKMETLDDTITDFTPPVSDACTQEYGRRFQYVSVEGNCFADGCPRPPNLNTSHLPLMDKNVYKSGVRKHVARRTWREEHDINPRRGKSRGDRGVVEPRSLWMSRKAMNNNNNNNNLYFVPRKVYNR